MRLIVSAMHRSGINAISKWLLRQSLLKSKPLEPFMGDWIETLSHRESLNIDQRFFHISQINHPDHHIDSKWLYNDDNVVMTIERESAIQAQTLMENMSGDWQCVFIVRSFKNWLASVVKAHERAYAKDPNNPIIAIYNIHEDIARYRTYLDRLGVCDFSPPEFSPTTIFYDSWVKSADYRTGICRDLGLRYTNCGYRDVPQNCGGSSFDGLEFDGKAHEMNVLERWKEFEDNEEFMKTLDRYSDIVEMSDRYCGV